MAVEITMPKLSDTMEEGTILRWFKRVGDTVGRGEVLAEVETDKADMELEAERSGILTEIRVAEGATAGVGAVLAVLEERSGAAQAGPQPSTSPGSGSVAAAPTGAEPTPPKAVPPPPVTRKPSAPPPSSEAARGSGIDRASPAPRRATPPAVTPREETPSSSAPHPTGRESASKMRLAIAKQMTSSKRDVPHFYVTCEIDMAAAADLRTALADAGTPERITYTHLIIRALALTLAKHPRVNASWVEGGIEFHDDINIGVAVAVPEGLVAPVIRKCQTLSLRAIARAAGELVEKAQAGKFGGDALTGGTFTLSNMGMLDIEDFTAVIIPPQAAILAVGAIKDRPVVRSGQLAVSKTMRVTLSVDHRVLNGIEAGQFLEDLKRVLERPALLLLDMA